MVALYKTMLDCGFTDFQNRNRAFEIWNEVMTRVIKDTEVANDDFLQKVVEGFLDA